MLGHDAFWGDFRHLTPLIITVHADNMSFIRMITHFSKAGFQAQPAPFSLRISMSPRYIFKEQETLHILRRYQVDAYAHVTGAVVMCKRACCRSCSIRRVRTASVFWRCSRMAWQAQPKDEISTSRKLIFKTMSFAMEKTWSRFGNKKLVSTTPFLFDTKQQKLQHSPRQVTLTHKKKASI